MEYKTEYSQIPLGLYHGEKILQTDLISWEISFLWKMYILFLYLFLFQFKRMIYNAKSVNIT